MANNEAGKTRVDDAQASKLSVSILRLKHSYKEYQCLNNSVFATDCRIYDALSNYKVH
jgi:hypothetical protein